MDTSMQKSPRPVTWRARVADKFTRLIEIENVLLLSTLSIFWTMWLWSWLSYGALFLAQRGGRPTEWDNPSLIALGTGSTLGALLMPALSDKVGRRKLIISTSALALASTISSIATNSMHQPGISLLIFLLSFSCFGLAPILCTFITHGSAPEDMVGTATGLTTATGVFTGFVFARPLMSAFGERFGPVAPIKVGLAFLIPLFLLSFLLKEPSKK